MDTWCRGVFGPDYGDALERGLPDALEQAIADAFFGQELPAVRAWSFDREDALRIDQRHVENPDGMAEALAGFWSRHPC